jgi:hypothetical protein
LWVPQADGFLFPFVSDESTMGTRRQSIDLDTLPSSLNGYLEKVREVLVRWKDARAVAIKFAVAYIRPLDFNLVSAEEANIIYDCNRLEGKPSSRDYKAIQDFMFHYVACEAGRLGLVVQIHTGIGADPYFSVSGSNPLLLETMFNEKTLRKTNFIMLHGGWPFEREAGIMLMKPNVFADFSSQTFLRSTEVLSEVLREWLEWYPEKVLFGTDAYSEENTPLADWEEKVWLTTRTSRLALTLALTRMMRAGQISRTRAEELATMVLRENAVRLYRLETLGTTLDSDK